MSFDRCMDKLKPIGQEHTLKFWHDLNSVQKQGLFKQVMALDLAAFAAQRKAVLSPPKPEPIPCSPFKDFNRAGRQDDMERGFALIKQGKAGCLIAAGGQGTRLRFDGPKGMFPVSVVKHKTLFQIFAEKVKAASEQAGRPLHLAIMTSPQNDEQTRRHFSENGCFGLDRTQVDFFCQSTLPLLDLQANLFLESPGVIAEGPDGNGSAVSQFVQAGIWEKWYAQGIRHLHFILVDNPLADPFDKELTGFHSRLQCESSIKCISREDPAEKLGLLLDDGGKIRIIEYSEIPEAEISSVNPDGSLKYKCANISLYCFDMDFLKAVADKHAGELPLHPAFKSAKHLNPEGKQVMPSMPTAWKFEKFIFDILPLAKTVKALLFPRSSCYAPLKNFEGPQSLSTVQHSLQMNDFQTLKAITGRSPKQKRLELSQEFHYPTEKFLEKWTGREIPEKPYLGYTET